MTLKISDLIALLEEARERWGDIEVRATWEGVTPEIAGVYRGRAWEGETVAVLLDSDDQQYRHEYEHPDDRALPPLGGMARPAQRSAKKFGTAALSDMSVTVVDRSDEVNSSSECHPAALRVRDKR
jgi:hypothetical protein